MSSEIILQNYYISAAGSGAPADIQFSPNPAGSETLPPHMRAEKATIRFTRGYDCDTLSKVASCGVYDIIIRRRG